jgi:hypothetical protein
MISLTDVEVIEGGAESEAEYFTALQRAINSLTAWKLQGSYGRSMMDAIESGKCMLANSSTRDYYGNRIPNRTEVQAGTKGSREYVVNHSGEAWAVMMEKVDEAMN